MPRMSEVSVFSSILSPSWMEMVQQTLATLQRGVGGECVLLVNGRGEVIAQTGIAEEIVTEEILPLLMEEAALTHRLGHHIGDGTGISVHYYEGGPRQVYVGVAARPPLLVVVISRQPPPRRPGLVWLFLRRTLQALTRLIASPEDAPVRKAGSLTPEQARALGLLLEE